MTGPSQQKFYALVDNGLSSSNLAMPYSEQLKHGAELAWYAVNPEADELIDAKQLERALHFLGLNPSQKLMHEFCGQVGNTAAFSQQDILHLAATVPVTTAGCSVTLLVLALFLTLIGCR